MSWPLKTKHCFRESTKTVFLCWVGLGTPTDADKEAAVQKTVVQKAAKGKTPKRKNGKGGKGKNAK